SGRERPNWSPAAAAARWGAGAGGWAPRRRRVLARGRACAPERAGAARDRARLLRRPEGGRDRQASAGAAWLGLELGAARAGPSREPAGGGTAVRHEEAWQRLPDLLDDRDDPTLLAHVRSCGDCQRQLFLLGRVDRLLRDRAAAQDERRPRRRGVRRTVAAAAAAPALVGALLAALVVLQHGPTHGLTFRTASGRAVGSAVMGHSDARNVSLSLTARDLPVD